jgi:hypothetical protein
MKKTIFAQLLSMAAIAALAVCMPACDKEKEEDTLSFPDNTSDTDLKAMLAHANASLGSKLTLTRSYKYEETTDKVAYSYDEVIQIDSTGKKYLSERKNVKADGKTNSLVRVRYVDGTTYYVYRVSTDYTKGSVNLDGEVTQCQQTIEPYQAEGYYSPSDYSIQYTPYNSDYETYEVSARDNKIIVKYTYTSGSISEENTKEIALTEDKKYKSVKYTSKRDGVLQTSRETTYSYSANPALPSGLGDFPVTGTNCD